MSTGITPVLNAKYPSRSIMMVRIQFSCPQCMLERKVSVRGREANESMPNWMKAVQAMVRRSHKHSRPACKSEHFNIVVPQPANAEWVGQDVEK